MVRKPIDIWWIADDLVHPKK